MSAELREVFTEILTEYFHRELYYDPVEQIVNQFMDGVKQTGYLSPAEVEAVKTAARDEGIRLTMDAADSTFQAQLKAEREKIPPVLSDEAAEILATESGDFSVSYSELHRRIQRDFGVKWNSGA